MSLLSMAGMGNVMGQAIVPEMLDIVYSAPNFTCTGPVPIPYSETGDLLILMHGSFNNRITSFSGWTFLLDSFGPSTPTRTSAMSIMYKICEEDAAAHNEQITTSWCSGVGWPNLVFRIRKGTFGQLLVNEHVGYVSNSACATQEYSPKRNSLLISGVSVVKNIVQTNNIQHRFDDYQIQVESNWTQSDLLLASTQLSDGKSIGVGEVSANVLPSNAGYSSVMLEICSP